MSETKYNFSKRNFVRYVELNTICGVRFISQSKSLRNIVVTYLEESVIFTPNYSHEIWMLKVLNISIGEIRKSRTDLYVRSFITKNGHEL